MDNQLICVYQPTLKTTALMDQFEQRDAQGEPVFRSLLLTDCFFVRRAERYTVSLRIERWDWRAPFLNDFMTFTKLKRAVAGRCFTEGRQQDAPAVVQQIFLCEWTKPPLIFSSGVLLHAQHSANRSGFGRSVCAGQKRYGEATPYLITGATLRKDNLPEH